MKRRDAVIAVGGPIREVAEILAAGILRLKRKAAGLSTDRADAAGSKNGKGGAR